MPSPTLTFKHFTSAANLATGTGTVLDAEFRREFTAVRSEAGAAILHLANTNADLAAIGMGHYIQARLDDAPVFLARVEGFDRAIKAPAEEYDQHTKVTCRGAIADWAKAKVQPSTPVGSKLWQRDRLFGWMSAELDISAMPAAVELWRQDIDDAAYGGKLGTPLGWIDPLGYWIWSESDVNEPPLFDPGTSYFFGEIAIAAPDGVALHIAADDAFVAYVDGVAAAASGEVNGWKRPFRAAMELEAGTHRIAVAVENFDRTAATNTAGLIAAVYDLDTSGNEDTLLLRTNATDWVCSHDPATPPGVTAKTVVETLFAEAQADGELTNWTINAVGTYEPDQQFSFPVGTDLLSVLMQLSETHIDFTFDPDSLTLNLYPYSEAGSATSVATFTSGLGMHLVRQRDSAVDGLLVIYEDGYTNVGSPGRQEFLALGAARTAQEAEAVATAELARLTGDLESVEIEPAPDSGAFSIYNLGDVVTVTPAGPDVITIEGEALTVDGEVVMEGGDKRIRAIKVQDDGDDGQLKVLPELEDRLDPIEVRTARAVRRMADGTIGGRSLSASLPQVSSGVETQRVELESDSFDWSSTGDATLEDLIDVEHNPMKFMTDGRIAWIRYEWNEAPLVDATVVGKIGGSVVFTHTLPANDDGHSEFPNEPISRSQKLTLTLTSVDDVARGLTAKVHQAVYT